MQPYRTSMGTEAGLAAEDRTQPAGFGTGGFMKFSSRGVSAVAAFCMAFALSGCGLWPWGDKGAATVLREAVGTRSLRRAREPGAPLTGAAADSRFPRCLRRSEGIYDAFGLLLWPGREDVQRAGHDRAGGDDVVPACLCPGRTLSGGEGHRCDAEPDGRQLLQSDHAHVLREHARVDVHRRRRRLDRHLQGQGAVSTRG